MNPLDEIVDGPLNCLAFEHAESAEGARGLRRVARIERSLRGHANPTVGAAGIDYCRDATGDGLVILPHAEFMKHAQQRQSLGRNGKSGATRERSATAKPTRPASGNKVGPTAPGEANPAAAATNSAAPAARLPSASHHR